MFLEILIVIIAGLLIGSFLNVVIFRMGELSSIINTRSHCPACKKEIKWYDLIPFLSFIILKTKCRNCQKPISWQYPVVEAGTAMLFLAIFLNFGNNIYSYFLMIISCFLIVIFVYDLKNFIIPDEMLYPAIVISIIYTAFGSLNSFKMTVYGIAISLGLMLILYLLGKGKWMGFGDVKLAILLGLLTPFPEILVTLFFAFIIGSIVGIILILLKKKTFKSEIPFGPFLIVGLYIGIFYGEKILGWYLGIL